MLFDPTATTPAPPHCCGGRTWRSRTELLHERRPDPVLPNGVRFVLLSHNTKLGAAKGATLVAEYLVNQGLA